MQKADVNEEIFFANDFDDPLNNAWEAMFRHSIKKRNEKKFSITFFILIHDIKVINRSESGKVGDECLISHPEGEFSSYAGDEMNKQTCHSGLILRSKTGIQQKLSRFFADAMLKTPALMNESYIFAVERKKLS